MYDSVERVCTGYTSLMPPRASWYSDRLNSLLRDSQSRRAYLFHYVVCVGTNGHSPHVNDADSYEKRDGSPNDAKW